MALMINHGGGKGKKDATVVNSKAVIDDVQDSQEPQTGSVKRGESTNDETPTLLGHLNQALASGESVIIYRDGVKIGTAKTNGKDWTFEDVSGGLITDKTYIYTARVEHSDGTKGSTSDGYDIVFDNSAPTQGVTITDVADDVAPVTGSVANNGYTNDTDPVITGTLTHATEKGEYVVVLRNGVVVGKALVTGTTWTFADSGLADGETYVYTALVKDAAGNTGAISKGYTIHIDTTAPDHLVSIDGVYDDVAPGIGIIGNNGVTNDTTPELRGQIDKALADNETLVIYRDGKKIGDAVVEGTSWHYTDSGLANNTQYKYTAQVEDLAGNTGPGSNDYSININFTGPSQLVAITAVTDDVDPVTGNVAHKGHTNDTKPDVSGTLSAALNNGEVVVVYRDGIKAGDATVTGNSWTYHEAAALSDGKHTYTAYVEDAAHNLGAASNSYEITVDTVAPDQTITLTEITDNKDPVTGKIPQGGETNDDTPTLHGKLSSELSAGEVVVIYRNGTKVGIADTDGTQWSFEDAGLASGSKYNYYAQVEDLAGNISQPSNNYNITLNTNGASQSTHILSIMDDQDPVTGNVLNGGYTNDITPTLTGSVTAELSGSEKLIIYRNGAEAGQAIVKGTSWTFTDTLDNSDGHYIYTAAVKDAAGNQGAMSNDYSINIDVTAPTQTAVITHIIDDEGAWQGNVAKDGITDDKTPTVVGTLDAALDKTEMLAVYRNGKLVGTAVVHNKEWAFTDSLANDGSYVYTAKVVDKAGNEGVVSDKYGITLDTVLPTQVVTITDIQDDKAPQLGSVKNGGFTNDDTPTLHGTLNSKLAAGETVSVYRDNVKVGTATVAKDGLSWSYTDNGLTDGSTYIYTAYAEDAAGNLGKVSDNYTITMDTTPPVQLVTITDIIDDKDPQTDSVKNGGFTNDDTPTLHGTLNSKLGAGETVSIYRGDSKVGTATVAKDGLSWSYTDKGLKDGTTYIYTAYAEDAAGNLGPVSDNYTITMDSTPPVQLVTIAEVMDDVNPVTGKVDNNGHTDDKTPTLNGTVSQALSNTEMVAVFRDGVFIEYAKVTGTNWTFTDTLTDDGKYSYTALVVDMAGNTGTESGKYVINVDTTVPDQTVKIISVLDDVKPFEGNIAKGGYTDDKTPELHGTVSAALKANQVLVLYLNDVKVGTVTVNNDLTWQYTGLLTNDGHYNWKAVVETLAGVPGASDEYDINLDTTIPEALATIAGYNDHVGNEQGPFGNGTTTDDRNPELFGKVSQTLKVRESVLVYDTTKGAVGSGKEVLMGTATMDADKNWSFFVPEAHRLVNGSSPKFEAVVTNGAGLGKHSDDFTLNVDLEIKVNEVNTLDTHPIISGSVGFQIYDDEHLEVTINGKTYSSLDGAVVVDPLNNTWYVKLPANAGLSANKNYDVIAKLLNTDNSIVVQDKTLNEVHIAKEPEAPVIPPSNDAANKATGMTIGENGAWRIFSNMNVLDQNGTNITNTSSFKTNTLKSNGLAGVYGSMSFIDFDRDGYMDIIGLDSRYQDGQQAFRYQPGEMGISSQDKKASDRVTNDEYYAFILGDANSNYGGAVDPKYSGGGSASAGTYSWWGGTALYDKNGDGYVDVLFGDKTPNDAENGGGYDTQLVWNNNGKFQKDVAYIYSNSGANKDPNFAKYGQDGQATPEKVVSSVDLNNDGNVDLIHGGSSGSNIINKTGVSGSVAGRLVVMSNKGDGGFDVSQILTGIDSPETKKGTILGQLNGAGFDGQSVVWADFNGDGWLDMFVGSVNASDGAKDLNSVVLFNDGKGHLAQDTAIGQLGQAKGAYNFTDKGNVGGALTVDWNMDGKADIVTIPRLDGDGSPIGKDNQNVTLQLNNSTGPVTRFDSKVLYTSAKNGKGTGYSGLLNIDVDWDGRQELMVFTGTNGAKFIKNDNELEEGTAMHIKILDQEGINAFFGNTVKLYDSNGNLVATQVINHQAGNQTSNSTGLLSFYGLKADETYNAVLLRNVNGVQQHVGAESHVGDFTIANVNASWGGLTTGKNWDSYVLTAESGNSASNANIGNGVVGTGYNDTFFATLGKNAYEGGGGSYLVNGARQWSDKGGIDIVDFKLAGKTNITVDLRETGYQNTGYGNQKLSNIEGVRGGEGDDTFYSNSSDNFFDGGAGNNTFHLGAGGQDTIMYRLLADNDTGGHGVDQINQFWVGTVEATANADIVNIGDLLVGYKGGSFDNVAKYVNGKAVITDATITDYLKLENGSLLLDRDGKGGEYNSVKIADLHFDNVDADKVDLAMLLANHQIVF